MENAKEKTKKHAKSQQNQLKKAKKLKGK